MRFAPFLLCAVLATSCNAALPRATAADARWAKQRWPSSSLDELRAGRERYVASCAGCHDLKLPRDVPPESWQTAVDEMESEHGVRLSGKDETLIVRYLVTLSTRESAKN